MNPRPAVTRRSLLSRPGGLTRRSSAERPAFALGSLLKAARQAMGTTFEVRVPEWVPGASDLACRSLDRIDALESQLTVYRDDSEVSVLNRTANQAPVEVEDGLFDLISFASSVSKATNGAYDVTSGALSTAWGFTRGPKRVPTDQERIEALSRTGDQHLKLDPETKTVAFDRAGVSLNFGSIGKGYAIDEAVRVIRDYWWPTPTLIQGGHSSVYALGSPPGTIAGRWRVSLRNPFDASRPLGEIALRDRGLGTSGTAFQCFEADGKRYGHLIDPRTGFPTESDCASVSVLAPTAAEADALSTAFYLMGPDATSVFLKDRPEIAAIFVMNGTGRKPPRLVLKNVGVHDFRPDPGVHLAMPRNNLFFRYRSFPLAAPRRYYPGFFGALFLILLRVAIGWHFLYEGVYKINTTPSQRNSYPGRALCWLLPAPFDKDKEPEVAFSSEGYLRNATGPLAPKFRGMVPDVNSLSKLERDPAGLPSRLKAGWKLELSRVSSHYAFTPEQKAAAEKELEAASIRVDDWFLKPDNAFRIKKYDNDLRNVLAVEQSSEALPYERTLAYKRRLEFDKERRGLVGEVDGYTNTLRDAWTKLATTEQIKTSGELKAQWTRLDLINISTMWGMVVVGLCLIVGLFTPLAALGAACFLTMFYLSMPPWPGLPVGKASEGHYLYVNKNLIEFFACLSLAATPSGLWLGLDALFFGRKKRPEPEAVVETSLPATTTVRIR